MSKAIGKERLHLIKQIRNGNFRAAAKLLTAIERGGISAPPVLKARNPDTGRAHVIGITGPSGTGKSSLINGLTTCLRSRGHRVGILAVDPTSPISGGAILGDRIRMRDHFTDPGVFIRSLSSRGDPGGIPIGITAESVHVLDALGMDTIFIETIGVGQDQVAVSTLAHTTAVVINPAMGDEIQILKAGYMEIADLFILNKADLPGADQMAHLLSDLIGEPEHVPVFKVSALERKGLEDVIKELDLLRTPMAPRLHVKTNRGQNR